MCSTIRSFFVVVVAVVVVVVVAVVVVLLLLLFFFFLQGNSRENYAQKIRVFCIVLIGCFGEMAGFLWQ